MSETSAKSDGRKGIVRALQFVTLVAVLVAVFLVIMLWATRIRIPSGIDVPRIDEVVSVANQKRSALQPVGAINELSEAVALAWKTLEDGKGKHFFHDSDTKDTLVNPPPEVVQNAQFAITELLTKSPVRLAPHAHSLTVPDAEGAPRSAETQLAETTLKLVSCYRRMSGVAIQRQQDILAIKYAEAGMLMLNAVAPVTNLEMLPTVQAEVDRLAEYGKSAAQSFGDWSDIERVSGLIDSFLKVHATFADAIDVEIVAWGNLREIDDKSSWNVMTTRRVAYQQLHDWLQLRDIVLDEKESTDARKKKLEAINPDLAKSYAWYVESLRRLQEIRTVLEHPPGAPRDE